MVHVSRLFSTDALREEMAAGWVVRQRHPTLPLSIYNYSRTAQYARRWNAVTTNCRALVLEDGSDCIVARAFPKFFNVGEHGVYEEFSSMVKYPECPPLPDEPFEIYEKLDGSLILVFQYAGRLIVASRGSFASEQSIWATAWIAGKPWEKLDKNVTYVCEAIYPDNRIVVDYKDREDLVLLAAFTPEGEITGELDREYIEEKWLRHIGGVVLHWYPDHVPTIDDLTSRAVVGTEEEGFVLRYQSGLRVKAKFPEYVRLHKLYTGLSTKDVWRALAADDLGPLLDQVPDEFDSWVRMVAGEIRDAFLKVEMRVLDWTGTTAWGLAGADRGAFARKLAAEEPDKVVRSCLFRLLDGQDYKPLIWRAVEPESSKPFAADH